MDGVVFEPIETPRLIMRRFRDTDLEPFAAYRNDPQVARYQSWEGITEAEAVAFVAEQREARAGVPGAWLQIALELREGGALVGDCALKTEADDGRLGEIGYTLARAYQGRGLASEAVAALLDYAFDGLKMHRIVAQVDCENSPSVALLERRGFRREGHFIRNTWFKGQWADEYLYAMLAVDWTARR